MRINYNSSLRMGLFVALSLIQVTGIGGGDGIAIRMQKRVGSGGSGAASGGSGAAIVTTVAQWNPHETAIIICDMWNQHWCKGATSRVAELAPRLNRVIAAARQQGMLIVHAPSDCMAYYQDFPGRKLALRYDSKKYEAIISSDNLVSEKGAVWPIDQSDGGCDDAVRCQEASPWRKEIDALEIKDGDAISDNGAEVAALFDAKGIKNVILTGVHTNMCVIGRSFGLRNMVRLGKNVVLMRDMTDAMYNSRMAPYVKHIAGRDLVINYIETYVCPTMLSTDIIGGQPFQF
jgi:nicotinamidase-related amidase